MKKENMFKQQRMRSRLEKSALQSFGESVYKDLQDLEIKVKDNDFWTPKEKWYQMQSIVDKYEHAQKQIESAKEQERYKRNSETIQWLRNKKQDEFVRQTNIQFKQRLCHLMFVHAEYLKKTANKKWIVLKNFYNDVKNSFHVY